MFTSLTYGDTNVAFSMPDNKERSEKNFKSDLQKKRHFLFLRTHICKSEVATNSKTQKQFIVSPRYKISDLFRFFSKIASLVKFTPSPVLGLDL